MRIPINKLVGRYTDGYCEVFVFLDELYDFSGPAWGGKGLRGVHSTELIGVTPEHHRYLTETDEGLIYRFEDYEEMHGKTPAEIIAWGKQEIAEAVEADGDCFERVYDTSYRDACWPQIRARGFDAAQFVAFDCTGAGTLEAITEVYEPELLAQARAWMANQARNVETIGNTDACTGSNEAGKIKAPESVAALQGVTTTNADGGR